MSENLNNDTELKPNRTYKCGCVCPTLSTPEVEKTICPACLVKDISQASS